MTVRKWKYEDIIKIAAIEQECFKGEAFSFGMLASSFDNSNCTGITVEDGGEVIGYGCITCVCETADIENVVVAEPYRRCGAGRKIVERLLKEAAKKGAEKVFLEVRVSNSAAIALYISYGFKGVYARTRYYSDGEDCLVMQKELIKDTENKEG